MSGDANVRSYQQRVQPARRGKIQRVISAVATLGVIASMCVVASADALTLTPHRHGVTTTTVLGAVPTGAVAGQSDTFTATVSNTSLPFTGTTYVQFQANGVSFGPAVAVVPKSATSPYTATATLTISTLGAGGFNISAHYNGGGGFNASTSATQGMSVSKASSSVTVTATTPAASAVYGQSVTFNVTVAAVAPGGGSPTGTVTVSQGASTVCTFSLTGTTNGAGSCAGAVPFTPSASVPFTASYAGDTNFLASSSSITRTINQASSSTTISSTAPSGTATYGQSTTFQVNVAAVSPGSGVATGNVTVSQGGTTICTFTLVHANFGQGSCTGNVLVTPGTLLTFTASYAGDANFAASSGTIAKTVLKASSTTTISSMSPSGAIPYGQSTTFNVLVAPVAPGSGGPTGAVTITVGPTTICSFTLASSDGGSGSCTAAVLVTPGVGLTFTATYAGDSDFAGSSGTATQTITTASTSMPTFTATPSTSPYGAESSVVFAASVSATDPAAGTPSGTVTVKQGALTLCTITLSSGSGNCSPATDTALTAGAYQVTATYGGTALFSSSSSSTSLTVGPSTSQLSAPTETASPVYGGSLAAHTTLSSDTSITALNGVVTFTIDAGPNVYTCTRSVSAPGGVDCSSWSPAGAAPALPPAGVYSISVSFAPTDATNLAGAGPVNGVAFTIGTDSATVAVVANNYSTTYGHDSNSVFTVTVATTHGETISAGDTATVNVGATSCSVSLVPSGTGGSGTCHLTDTALSAGGPFVISASFAGDSNVAAAGPSTAPSGLTVAKDSTSLSVSSSPTSVTYGDIQAAVLTVSVVTGNGEPLPQAESVTIHVGSASCVAAIDPIAGGASGTCTLGNIALGGGGPYAISVSYAGDTDLAGSGPVNAPTGLTVVLDSTAAFMAVSENPSTVTYGNESATQFTATLYTGNGEPLPTTVHVTVDVGTSSCNVSLVPNANGGTGTCTLSARSLPAGGPYEVSVSFGGDGNLKPSGPVTSTTGLTVTPGSTTTAVSITAPSGDIAVGQSVSFHAVVSPVAPSSGTPTGTVTVIAGGNTVCVITLTALSAGAGNCTGVPNAAPASPLNFSATYNGDNNFTTSGDSTQHNLVVAATQTSLTSTRNPTVAGGALSLTAHITIVAPAVASLGASVKFTANGVVITGCGAVAVGSHVATCIANGVLSAGTDSIVATYLGDADTSVSVSSPLVIVVDSKNTAWVKHVMPDLLGRAADALSISTIDAKLAAGATRTSMALLVMSGREYKVRTVTAIFQRYLHRNPSAGELRAWLPFLVHHSYEQLRAAILGGKEYFRRAGGTNPKFLGHLFLAVLGHGPTRAQAVQLLAQLGHKVPRASVALSLLRSTESLTREVNGWMAQFLHRKVFSGNLAWVSLFKHGGSDQSVIAGLLATGEYYDLATK